MPATTQTVSMQGPAWVHLGKAPGIFVLIYPLQSSGAAADLTEVRAGNHPEHQNTQRVPTPPAHGAEAQRAAGWASPYPVRSGGE